MRHYRRVDIPAVKRARPGCQAQRGLFFFRTQLENRIPGRIVHSGEEADLQVQGLAVGLEAGECQSDAADPGPLFGNGDDRLRILQLQAFLAAILQPDQRFFGSAERKRRALPAHRDFKASGIELKHGIAADKLKHPGSRLSERDEAVGLQFFRGHGCRHLFRPRQSGGGRQDRQGAECKCHNQFFHCGYAP